VEKQSFNPRYVDLDWPGKPAWLARWKEGQTGFPIVDAGMRELSQTGYMHNRVRMIVASFLTKDLLLDWRLGEKHFMHKLLDGDLAANNGSWQWAASTGCDPQPYFRVFNPWLQSKEFDAKGDYIRRFVPELAEIDPRALHKPDGERGGRYPAPMVAHEQQRARAISLYKRA
jgi:deoxyribodipyrimidine photo-lyase